MEVLAPFGQCSIVLRITVTQEPLVLADLIVCRLFVACFSI